MPELWGRAGGVNRKFRELHGASGGANRKLKELWAAKDAVNGKIFAAFPSIIAHTNTNSGSDGIKGSWSGHSSISSDGTGLTVTVTATMGKGTTSHSISGSTDLYLYFSEPVEVEAGQIIMTFSSLSTSGSRIGDVFTSSGSSLGGYLNVSGKNLSVSTAGAASSIYFRVSAAASMNPDSNTTNTSKISGDIATILGEPISSFIPIHYS